MAYRKVQIYRGLEQNIPVLSEGEPAFTTDKKSLYIGTSDGNLKIGETFDFENWGNVPGAVYSQTKNASNVYITTLHINTVKKAERQEFPQNAQGQYITIETVYKPNGTIESTRTMKEYKVGNDWKAEVT